MAKTTNKTKPTRFGPREGQALVEAFQKSGFTATAYCQQQNISIQKLFYWKKKMRQKNQALEDTFFLLPARTKENAPAHNEALQITTPKGLRVTLPSDITPDRLRAIIKILNEDLKT